MNALWKNCLEEIEKVVLPENYDAWFLPVFPRTLESDCLTLVAPNDFYKKCLEENYRDLIESTLETLNDKVLTVDIVVCEEGEKPFESGNGNGNGHGNGGAPAVENVLVPLETPTVTVREPDVSSCLNPRYQFDNFIIGSSNQFAHAASMAVASNPAHAYNPLFVYGGVGLGKTHLLHAIGNSILEKNPDARVRYLSAESFTIDLIQSIKRDDMHAFRKRYRPLDVLLVDDIQFIAGKERTQEEFFYTFNTLYESHKQVILSSDRFPKDMQNMEERLRSRFECGLIADIKSPDLETKTAILFKKAEQHGKTIPQDVALFICGNIKTNIRELEGLLLRIIAFSSFTRKTIDIELAREVLKEFTLDKNKNFTIPIIQKIVANFFKITVLDLKSPRRSRQISIPRQISMYLCREFTKFSLPDIGKQFGGKDHTTVLFAHKKISNNIKQDNELEKTIQKIITQIEGR